MHLCKNGRTCCCIGLTALLDGYLRVVRVRERLVSRREVALIHAVLRLLGVLAAVLHVDHGPAWYRALRHTHMGTHVKHAKQKKSSNTCQVKDYEGKISRSFLLTTLRCLQALHILPIAF